MEKLTDEQLSDFISRAAPQLTPELTSQMFSIIQELIVYRSKKNEEKELLHIPTGVKKNERI